MKKHFTLLVFPAASCPSVRFSSKCTSSSLHSGPTRSTTSTASCSWFSSFLQSSQFASPSFAPISSSTQRIIGMDNESHGRVLWSVLYFMILSIVAFINNTIFHSDGSGLRFWRPPRPRATSICIPSITFSSRPRCTACSRPCFTSVTWLFSLSRWVSDSWSRWG